MTLEEEESMQSSTTSPELSIYNDVTPRIISGKKRPFFLSVSFFFSFFPLLFTLLCIQMIVY